MESAATAVTLVLISFFCRRIQCSRCIPSLKALKERCSIKEMPSISMLFTFAPNLTALVSLPRTIGRTIMFCPHWHNGQLPYGIKEKCPLFDTFLITKKELNFKPISSAQRMERIGRIQTTKFALSKLLRYFSIISNAKP